MKLIKIITGVSGSGKTTYKNNIATDDVVSISIDDFFNYDTLTYLWEKMLSELEDCNEDSTLIIDGYLFHLDPQLELLKEHLKPVDIEIDVLYTTLEKLYYSQRSNDLRLEIKERLKYNLETDINKNISQQNGILFHLRNMFNSKIVNNVEYFFRNENNELIKKNEEHYVETIMNRKLDKPTLLKFINEAYGTAQKYQTIQLNGEIIQEGTEKCWITWENIEKLNIEWTNKTVCDLGCFYGYFSVKAHEAGAGKIYGIDQNETIIKRYNTVMDSNSIKGYESHVVDLGKNGGIVPNNDYDIILALNMLHHVKRNTDEESYIKVLNSIFESCKEFVTELNENEIPEVLECASKNGFIKVERLKSHRNTMFGQRHIIHCKKD